ncbi:MAG TPA: L-lactate permease [Spirochaetia bacterium]
MTPFATPVGGLGLSALAAAVPLVVLFALMAWGRLPGWVPALAAAVTSMIVAAVAWRMPVLVDASAALEGVATALFPILWIVVSALWVHSLAVDAGQFEVIRSSLASITADRRLQALFIAFAFGAFLEGASGFGTPVAIAASMLVGLGFEARAAASLCLVANSTPVAFAAAGIPVAVAAGVSGLDVVALARAIGWQVSFLSLVVPLWLTVILCGWKRSVEIWPALVVAGVLMALTQLVIASVSGPWTAGILSGIVTLAGLWLFLRVWKPRTTWDFPGAPPGSRGVGPRAAPGAPSQAPPSGRFSAGAIVRAWMPYILMSLMVLLWSVGPVSALLKKTDIVFPWPGLGGARFTLPLLSTPGTAIFLAAILAAILLPGIGPRQALASLGRTVKGLAGTILTVCLILATAYVMNVSGMSTALGQALAATGVLFPLVSPFLGWLGVVVTGSDTSSNALFGALQKTTAQRLGMDPVLLVAANASGGVAGKMVSPQSIAVATASTHLKGQEGRLFRSTVLHSLAMTLIIGLIVLLQAWFPGGTGR